MKLSSRFLLFVGLSILIWGLAVTSLFAQPIPLPTTPSDATQIIPMNDASGLGQQVGIPNWSVLPLTNDEIEPTVPEPEIQRIVAQASAETGVPADLLYQMGLLESQWNQRKGRPSIDQAYGVMGLRDNNNARTLQEAAQLLQTSTQSLKDDYNLNVRGAAFVLRSYFEQEYGANAEQYSSDLTKWVNVVKRYSGLADSSLQTGYARQIYTSLNAEGYTFNLDALGLAEISIAARGDTRNCTSYSGVNDVAPAHTNNYSVGNRTPIDRIVIHVGDGYYWGGLSWFQDPNAQVSAHYFVSLEGRIGRSVCENDTAWHAGNWNMNTRSIGIEHEGWGNQTQFTNAMYQSTAALVRDIAARYNIPLDREHIIGHYQVVSSRPNCPGSTWNWDYFMSLVNNNTSSWNFATERHGWQEKNGLKFLGHVDGGMVYDIIATDSWLESPSMSLSASSYPYLHIYMETQADSCGQIYWRRIGEGKFDESRRINIQPKNTTGTHLIVANMASNPNWTGTIAQLRLDPACTPDTSPNGLRINRIEFSKENCTAATTWDFTSQRHGWQERHALTFSGHIDGGMHYKVTGNDPRVNGPLMCGISTQSHRYLVIQMASQVDACGQIFFTRAQDINFSQASGDDRHFEIKPSPSGATHNIVVDLASNPLWQGTANQDNVTRMRIDPACVPSGAPDGIRIDKMYFTNNPPSKPDTPTPTPLPEVKTELLNNGGFEQPGGSNAVAAGWTLKNPTKDKRKCNKDTKIFSHSGNCAFQFTGNVGKTVLEQSINSTGVSSGDELELSAYIKASSLSGAKMLVKITYSDGGVVKLKYPINTGTYAYTASPKTLTLADDVTAMKLIISIRNGRGKFLIDDVSLLLSASTSSLVPLP